VENNGRGRQGHPEKGRPISRDEASSAAHRLERGDDRRLRPLPAMKRPPARHPQHDFEEELQPQKITPARPAAEFEAKAPPERSNAPARKKWQPERLRERPLTAPKKKAARREEPFSKHRPAPRRFPRWYFGHSLHYVADGGASTLIPLFLSATLGGSVSNVGVLSAATSSASVPSSIAWSELSDRIERRKMFILIDYFGAGLLFLLMGLATTFEQFLGLNILFGIVAAASVSMGTVIITETVEAKRWTKAIGTYTEFGGVGWIIGLLLCGIWLEAGIRLFPGMDSLRVLFFILAAVTFVAGFIALRLVPDPKPKPFAPHHVDKLVVFQGRIIERARHLPLWMYRRKYREAVHEIKSKGETVPRPLKLYFLAVLFLFSGFTTVYTPFPIFLKNEMGSGWLEIFLLYIVSSVTSAVMYSRAGDIIQRIGERRTLININFIRVFLSTSFGVLSLLVVSGVRIAPLAVFGMLFALQAAIGFFWAFVSVASTTLVSKCAPPGTKGENIGLFNATVSVGGILGALAGGEIALYLGYAAAFFAGVGMVILGILALVLNRRLDGLAALHSEKEWKEPA
jgi:MFS family permease